MKNVLFATTALVALAGAATAGDDNFTLTGDANVTLNSLTGLSWGLNGTLAASVEVGAGITAAVSTGFTLDNEGGWMEIDTIPLLTLTSDHGVFSFGNIGGFATSAVATTSGMDNGFISFGDIKDQEADANGDAAVWGIRGDVIVSGFTISVSAMEDIFNDTQNLNYYTVAVAGTVGSVDVAAGYDLAVGTIGASVGTSFGAVTVTASAIIGGAQYTDNDDNTNVFTGPGTSYGVEVGYDGGAVSGSVYAALNSGDDTNFGGSVTYASGAMTATATVDGDSAGAFSYTVEAGYEIMDGLTAVVGTEDFAAFYGRVTYVLDAGEVYISYATADAGGNNAGIEGGVSTTF